MYSRLGTKHWIDRVKLYYHTAPWYTRLYDQQFSVWKYSTAVLWCVTIFQKHLPWVFFWTWPTFGHSWRYTWRTIRIIRWITGRGARIRVRRRSQFSQFFILACLFFVVDFRTKAFSLEGNCTSIFWSNATEIARQILLAKYLTYGLSFWSTIFIHFIKSTAGSCWNISDHDLFASLIECHPTQGE